MFIEQAQGFAWRGRACEFPRQKGFSAVFEGDVYGKRALDFVSALSAMQDWQKVREMVEEEMRWYGLTFVTSWSLPYIGGDKIDCMDLNTRPPSYTEHYQRDGVLTKDPVVRALRRDLVCASWSDVLEDKRVTKSERFVVEEARDYGATDGFTVPIVSRSGCIGVFSPCGFKPDLSPRARAALELVGLYSHQALQRSEVRHARNRRRYVPLTPREREVMRWIAVGKTNFEMGEILGIQASTVKTIAARAFEKLDACNRSYAVTQAFRLGELDLNF